jgi:hypothetical protein
MKAGSIRIAVIFLFVLALVAGISAGLLASKYAAHPVTPTSFATPALSDLDLSADQQLRIKTLWEKVKDDSDHSYVQVSKLQQQQQQDLINLLTDEQKKQYSKVNLDYQNQITKLKADRDLALKKAFDETRKLLSPVQRDRYDEILKSRFGSNADPTQEARPAVRTSMPSAGITDGSSREPGA